MSDLPAAALGAAWRAALPSPRRIPLDAAGCACASRTVLAATTGFLEREAELGGYPAEVDAAPVIARARAHLGALVGVDGDAVALAGSATLAFSALLAAWPLPAGSRLGWVPSEYGSNVLALEALARARGWELAALPVGPEGRIRVDDVAGALAGLALVTFPVVASHRGVVQPAAEVVALAHEAGLPVVLDVAQAAGHVPLAHVGADAYVGTARKWLRGPRGGGWVAASPTVGAALVPDRPTLTGVGATGVARLGAGEGSIAARVGLAAALDELAEAGPETVFARLAALGRLARGRLHGLAGWSVLEPLDEASALVTLSHPDRQPPAVARTLLEDGIVVSAIPAERAPADLDCDVLRVSLHAYCQPEDLDRLEFSLRR